MNKCRLSREHLYKLVWEETLGNIAMKWSTSVADLKKVCNDMEIPLPQIGYWSQVKYSKTVSLSPLPSDYTGKNWVTFPLSAENSEDDPLFTRMYEIENNPSLPIKVPLKLSKPHHLIIEAKRKLNDPKRNIYDGHIKLYNKGLNISISPKMISRGLRFMDTLIKLLLARNHQIKLDEWVTYTVIYDIQIEIRLFEIRKTSRYPGEWGGRKYTPTGKLKLQYDSSWRQKEFIDGRLPLEDQLVKIVAKLELLAEQENIDNERYERKRVLEEKREGIERALKERRSIEVDKFKSLISNFNRWHTANTLRGYLKSLHKGTLVDKGSDSIINWGNRMIDWYDPTNEREDSLLIEEDRVSIDDFLKPKQASTNRWHY
jgi:hypothetical protein